MIGPHIIRRFTSFCSHEFSHEPFAVALWTFPAKIASILSDVLRSHIYGAPGLHLGKGSYIKGGTHVTLGRKVYVHGNLWLEAISEYREQRFTPQISIGDRVCFSNGVHVSCIESIVIHSDVLVGSHVHISDHSHGEYRGPEQSDPFEPPAFRKLAGGPVTIGAAVWIGDNAVIIGPVRIGEGAIIGANSVVKADVAPGTIVAGTPARVIKSFERSRRQWERV